MMDLLQSASMPLLAMLAQSTIVTGLALLAGRFALGRNVALRISVYRASIFSLLVLLVVGPAVRTTVAPLIQLGNPPQSTVASSTGGLEFVATPIAALPNRSALAIGPSMRVNPQISVKSDLHSRPTSFRLDGSEAFSLVYLAGSTVLLGGVFAGSFWIYLLRKKSTPHARINDAVISGQVLSAFVAGAARPTIFLPTDIDDNYSADMVDAIVRHERVHIEQRDCLWNLVTRIACACSWMSPLTWILAANLRRDSELLCDQLVLKSGLEPALYASCLLRIAETLASSPAQRLVGIGIVAPKSQLSTRISLMLNTSTHPIITVTQASKFRIAALFAMALAGATMVVSASTSHRILHDATPDGTVKEFFAALNKEDWRGAISRIEGANVDTVVAALQKFPRQEYGRIIQIPDISKVTVTGDLAAVRFQLRVPSRGLKMLHMQPREDTARLHLVGGDWKIVSGDDAHGVVESHVEVAKDPRRLAQAKAATKRSIVLVNLKNLALGALMYAGGHEDKYPPSQERLKADLSVALGAQIKSNKKSLERFWLDADGKPMDVRLNPSLFGKSGVQVQAPANCVLLSLGPRGHLQTVEGMIPIAFCDGHVKMLTPEAAAKVSWE
jgi:prepilin-type processing-associated H-X9-DG protein